MTKAVLFYSDLCPDTPAFMNELSRYELDVQTVNITSSMGNLKAFLQVRDNRKEFLDKKERGHIGIPVILTEEGHLIFNQDDLGQHYPLKVGKV